MSAAFGIYVHWPYCAAKCPYCDFNSHVRDGPDETRWAKAITCELDSVAELQGKDRPDLTSIFFGGGTPSLMSGKAVATVLDAIAANWSVSPQTEITLEANPNSVEQSRFRDYRAAGVNRVSIGVQALDDLSLKFLGRLHSAEEAKAAVKLGMEIFPRVSFDLIYARPKQTLEDWRRELSEALSFGTEHLSLYQLTIEKGTAFETLFRQGKLDIPKEDCAADLFEATQGLCEDAGLPAYEISNHARKDAEARHNLLYWRYQDYAGVGPGAHGRLNLDGTRTATQAERLPERWLRKVEDEGSSLVVEKIAPHDAAREHLLMSLRLREGLDVAAYKRQWGSTPSPEKVRELEDGGLLWFEHGRLLTTPRGRLLLNSVVAELAA
ncbi:MAG: radical SAM family heme chaperone HemW [Micropepsaceae bacterium]